MSQNVTCSDCANGRWELTPTGRIKRGESGRCAATVEIQISFPPCFIHPQIQRIAIWHDYDATKCPMFVPLEGKPKKRDGSEPTLGYEQFKETR